MSGNIKDIYRQFNPGNALDNSELIDYYVGIEQNERQIESISSRLELSLDTHEPIKLLFMGHIGSGKSTALNRLVSRLKCDMGDNFFIVKYDILELLDENDVDYTDILFSVLSKIIDEAQANEIDIEYSIIERVSDWGQNVIVTKVTEKKKEYVGGIKLTAYLLGLMARMRDETTTRMEVRNEIQPRVTELINLINEIIAEVEKSGRQVLVIIDNLEKCDPKKALDLFYWHGLQLKQPKCKIIYTFPISLRSSDQFQDIKDKFDNIIVYHNIVINSKKDKEDLESSGRIFLREVVKKRVSLDLFESDALEFIINMSGGVIKEYIRIIRDTAVDALTAKKNLIDMETAIGVVNGIKDIYQMQLSDQDYEFLVNISKRKDITRDERLINLVHNLSVLEYKNGRNWCDLNPIVRSLLIEKQLLK